MEQLSFDTLTFDVGAKQEDILRRAAAENLNLRVIIAGECGPEAAIGISLDETASRDDVVALWEIFAHGKAAPDFDQIEASVIDARLRALVYEQRQMLAEMYPRGVPPGAEP